MKNTLRINATQYTTVTAGKRDEAAANPVRDLKHHCVVP